MFTACGVKRRSSIPRALAGERESRESRPSVAWSVIGSGGAEAHEAARCRSLLLLLH